MLSTFKPVALAALLAIPAALVAATPADAHPRVKRWLSVVDVNGDGVISRAELRRARLMTLARLDSNGNGVFDPDDRAGRFVSSGAAPRLEALVKYLDANNDGVVSRREIAHGPMPIFDAADTNRDNRLTGAEIKSFLAAFYA